MPLVEYQKALKEAAHHLGRYPALKKELEERRRDIEEHGLGEAFAAARRGQAPGDPTGRHHRQPIREGGHPLDAGSAIRLTSLPAVRHRPSLWVLSCSSWIRAYRSQGVNGFFSWWCRRIFGSSP